MENMHDAKLRQLLEVFLEENTKLNLSALREEESCWIGNILDSLALLEILPSFTAPRSPLTAIDIGTGGGFPLLPLAITLPKYHFTGLDSTKKKLDAIERITQKMNIKNTTLVWGRAEELGKDPKYARQYDLVLARAVASLSKLLEWTHTFVKNDGYIVLWKSMNIEEEQQESQSIQKKRSLELVKSHEYELPEGFGRRQLLVFKKNS